MLNIQLYNKMNNTPGYLDKNGIVQRDLDAYWSVTGFMQVTPGSKCTYNGLTFATNDQYGAFYDIHQDFIKTFTIKAEDTEFIVPDNVYYVRFSLCKHTKINLFNSTLDEGSINTTSGTDEAGANFLRSNYLLVGPNEDLHAGETYTFSTTEDIQQVTLYYYRETLDHSLIFAGYTPTEFNPQPMNKVVFTIPETINNLVAMRARFYNPDANEFDVMLNAGETTIPYVPYTTTNNDDTNTFGFYIYAEAYKGFRDELYQWIKSTVSPNITEGDLDIIVMLMCYIFGDLSGLVYNLKAQIDPDLAEEAYLRHLGSNIGYEWNKGLSADEQREAMKLYIELQKKRGTDFSLKNLIAVFGQTRNSYYSTSDLRGVKITYGGKNGEPVGTPDSNDLYPGDIEIELPSYSKILIDAIDNIRLIGTRIIFTLVTYCGPIDFGCEMDSGHEVHVFFDPAYWGYDPTIEEFRNIAIEEAGSDVISDIADWPILTQRVYSCMANCSCIVYTSQVEPYATGPIWNIPELQRYQGFLLDEETLKDDDTMYGYDGQPPLLH